MKTQQQALQWALAQDGNVLSWGGYSQCVAYIRKYADFLGFKQPPSVPSAKDLWSVDWGDQFARASSPAIGDIGILKPTTNNKDGHINIVVGSLSFLYTMDQNFVNPIIGGKVGSPIRRVTWQYPNDRFYGFIRPKFKEESMTRGVMAAMKFLATRQNECTDAEFAKYANDVEAFVQYLTRVQAEHGIGPVVLANIGSPASQADIQAAENWRTFLRLIGK